MTYAISWGISNLEDVEVLTREKAEEMVRTSDVEEQIMYTVK